MRLHVASVDPSRPPLGGRYGATASLVLVALCPFIVVTTSTTLLQKVLVANLRTDALALEVVSSLANAGYAFGAVVAVALVKRFPPRPLFIVYEVGFAASSALVALSGGVAAFGAGRVLEGLFTGLLLVAALPPLVTGFGSSPLPLTAAIVDLGLFGATTLGPLLGGALAGPGDWRAMFWVLGALGAAGAILGYLSVGRGEPLDPDVRLDRLAIVLALGATVLPFLGASELTALAPSAPVVWAPLAAGAAALGALLAVEYRRRDPLTPVKLLVHTFAVIGVLAAMAAGAAAVALLELVQVLLLDASGASPLETGVLLWPEIATVAVAAVLFGSMLRRRSMPVLVVAGAAALAAAGAAIATAGPSPTHLRVLLVAAAIGFGAGATVSPGLFLAALSCPSSELGPTFALVELLRSEAAFLLAPVVLRFALEPKVSPRSVARGVDEGGVIVLVLLGVAALACALLWRLARARLQAPDLDHWLEDGAEALDSPPLAAAHR